MALDLRQTFDKARNAGVAGALALALVFAPVAATQADNASTPQAQQVSLNTSNSAITRAADWSLANRDGVSIAVFLGTESKITPQQIQDTLSGDFAKHGVSKVAFFFEQNDIPNTVLAFSTKGHGDGPFNLGVSRKEVPRIASQLKFENARPELASN